ncbi:Isochorismatase hydrolase, partial [Linderina pennispora]
MAATTTRTVSRNLGRLNAKTTAFFLCDIQEKFRPGIHAFASVVQILEVPLIVTEQYPKGLGHTAPEIDISHASLVDAKTKFSMVTEAVAQKLRELDTRSVVLYGIESHVCVMQTCLELLDNDYDVHVVADGDPKFKQISNLVKEFQAAAKTNELLHRKRASL